MYTIIVKRYGIEECVSVVNSTRKGLVTKQVRIPSEADNLSPENEVFETFSTRIYCVFKIIWSSF